MHKYYFSYLCLFSIAVFYSLDHYRFVCWFVHTFCLFNANLCCSFHICECAQYLPLLLWHSCSGIPGLFQLLSYPAPSNTSWRDKVNVEYYTGTRCPIQMLPCAFYSADIANAKIAFYWSPQWNLWRWTVMHYFWKWAHIWKLEFRLCKSFKNNPSSHMSERSKNVI